MAKYYSSTFGKISGKHGTAVAVIMKDGSTYLRKYTKPSNPRTDKQQAHRAKFALSSRALVPFNPIFKETMGVTSGISIARSHAFKNAIVGQYPSLAMDYKKLIFSLGPIAELSNPSTTISESVVTINWDFTKAYNSNKSDCVNIVIFNKDANKAAHFKSVAIRSDKKCDIGIHETWAKSELYVWAYLTNGDKSSDSVFVGAAVGTPQSLSGLSACPNDYHNNSNGNRNIVSGTHAVEPPHGINQAIMALIVMLYNLFGLLKQVVVNIDTKYPSNTLIHKDYNTSKSIKNIYKESVFKLHSEGTTWCRTHTISKGISEVFKLAQRHLSYQYTYIRHKVPILT